MRYLKTIFDQQIYLKWDNYLLRIEILSIDYVGWMFLSNIHRLNLSKMKKGKMFPNAFIEIVNESNRKLNQSWVDH